MIATATKPKKKKKTQKRRAGPRVPQRWRKLMKLIPGYDPIATAAPGDYFDIDDADKAVAFFAQCLKHIEGELAGQPFILEPWEQAGIGCTFGWKRADGTRRYREVFWFIPRKNGKTPLAGGIGNYVTFCDDEEGQQNICAAGDREQATKVFRWAAGMIRREPELDRRCKIYGEQATNQTRRIVVPSTGSFLTTVAGGTAIRFTLRSSTSCTSCATRS